MELDRAQGAFVFERPMLKHLIAACVAVFVSLLFHGAVIRVIPPLPVGKPPDLSRERMPIPTRLAGVFPEPSERIQRPARFRPEDPGRMVDVKREVLDFEDALSQGLPEPPAEARSVPLTAEDSTVIDPKEVAESPTWSARQEVLQVEERLFDDAVAARPRRYAPSIPRSEKALDISLPFDLEGIADSAGLEAKLAARSREGPIGLPPGDPLAWALRTERTKVTEEIHLEATSRLAEEPLGEVSSHEAIENLLALDVATYTETKEPYTYFRIQIKRNGAEALPVLPKDVILIQDVSQSMTQRKLNDCKAGLLNFMDRLNPGDRFNIIAFRDDVIRCFDTWRPFNLSSKTEAWLFIDALKATGKTDVYASLRPLLDLERDPNRPLIGILVTDGRPTTGVRNSSDIIVQFGQANRSNVALFALGGGRRVNRMLLDMISYGNRGDSLVVQQRSEIPQALDAWGAQLRRPVLTSLTYRFSGLSESEVYPTALTDLFLDRPLVIYGRVKDPGLRVAFQIVGNSQGQTRDMVYPLMLADAPKGSETIRAEWARHKVLHMVSEHIMTGDDSLLPEIHNFSDQFGLYIPYGPDVPLQF